MKVLEAKNIEFRREGFQLGPLSFELERASIKLLLGPNGAGKTSLLKLLSKRLRLHSGSFSLSSNGLSSLGVEPILVKSWTVKENFDWAMKLTHEPKQLELYDWVKNFWHRPASQLSAGQTRRVELVLALSIPFQVVLLDEPFVHLDDKNKSQFSKLIDQQRAAGKSFLISAHRPEDVPLDVQGSISL